MIIDIHTHKSVNSGNPAIRNLTFNEAEIIFANDEKGFFSLGFHPWYADKFTTELMDKLTTWSIDSRFIILGECGLDKNSKVSIAVQLHVFKLQILLSEKLQMPLIVHCVGCFNELFELKKELKPSQLWIIHGFRGKPDLANQILKANCDLSFGEYFNSESVLLTPLDHLFMETDESKLTISEIYHTISKLKKCKVEDLIAGENLIKSITSLPTFL